MDKKDEIISSGESSGELDPGIQALANMADKMGEGGSGSEYNEFGFNSEGIHRNGTRYDDEGYGADGFDEIGVDREGFDREGFGTDGRDREGFDRLGLNAEKYDREGRYGVGHRDAEGYDRYGFNRRGYDREGFDRRGYDKEGYDREGFNRQHFDRNGINRRTGTLYNSNGWDARGFNADGWDRDGYGKDGYNADGYNRKGYNRQGYDSDGYDKDGFDIDGYNWKGYNRSGFDVDGYNSNGYDSDGYDREGLDKDGYTKEYNAKFNKFGIDENGYMKNGEMDPDVEFAISFSESGIKDQIKYAAEKGLDEKEVRERIESARKKCPNIDEIIKNLLLTGNKMRVAAISNDCEKFISGELDADGFWGKHPRLNISEVLSSFINDPEKRKQFSDRTVENLVLDSNNIERNLRIFGTSQYDVSGALKGIEDFKRIYTRFGTNGTPEQIQKKRENTKKIFDTIKYLNRYRSRNLDSLLGSRQSFDGGQTWIEFNGETIGQAMDALKKDKRLVCVQTVKDYIINQSKNPNNNF